MAQFDWLLLAGATVFAALVLVVSHWVPLLNTPGVLKRYIFGVTTLWLAFALWRLPQGDYWTPLGLALIVIVGGGAVMAAYFWDEYVQARKKAEKAEAVDDGLP